MNGACTVLRSLGNVATGAAFPNCTLPLDSNNVPFSTTYSAGMSDPRS
jgi:hypothetical protein